VEPQHTASVKFTLGFADMPNAERSARAQIAEALSRMNMTAGDGFTLFRRLSDGRMHYEPGTVVPHAFISSGEVVSSQLPGGRAVKYV
ncbi:UNVERIFIED_CONTAM: hypothetical protein NY100_25660, partial [Prevotella sp. 15_C9]